MRKLTGSRVANAIIIVALATVPLLYSSLLTWAYEAPIPGLTGFPRPLSTLTNRPRQPQTGKRSISMSARNSPTS